MANKRKPTPKKTRFDVFKRDAFTCQYCGRTPPTVVLEVDHIVPVADGGADQYENLITSCCDCNQGKGARSLGVLPPSIDGRIEEHKERVAQLSAFNALLADRQRELQRQAKRLARLWPAELPPENIRSIRTFCERMPYIRVKEAMELALDRIGHRSYSDAFRYFCGTCWKIIKGG